MLGIGLITFFSSATKVPPDTEILQRLNDIRFLRFASQIYDTKGHNIGEYYDVKRYYTKIDQVPKHMISAFLSAEDQDFFSHGGVDYAAMVRAAIANIVHMGVVQGASTITQQLARNIFLTRERSFERKLAEIQVAWRLEELFDKKQILELYLNTIYLGHGAYGVEAASRVYFGKSVGQLQIPEAALIAGLPQAPSRLDPYKNLAGAKSRQQQILQRMCKLGHIRCSDVRDHQLNRLNLVDGRKKVSEHRYRPQAYFINHVRSQLEQMFEYHNLSFAGFNIETTMDRNLQRAVESVLQERLAKKSFSYVNLLKAHREGSSQDAFPDKVQAASLIMDTNHGNILAMQGGIDFKTSQFNRTVLTSRPMGHLALIMLAAIALEQGYQLDSSIGSRASAHQRYVGQSIFEMLANQNLPAADVLLAKLGTGTVKSYLSEMGLITKHIRDVQDVMNVSMTPLQVAQIFGAMFNRGIMHEPAVVRRISDIYKSQTTEVPRGVQRQLFSAHTAYALRFAFTKMAGTAGGNDHTGTFDHLSKLHLVTVANDLKNAWYLGGVGSTFMVTWMGAEFGKIRIGNNWDEAKTMVKLAGDMILEDMTKHLTSPRHLPVLSEVLFKRTTVSINGQNRRLSLPFIVR